MRENPRIAEKNRKGLFLDPAQSCNVLTLASEFFDLDDAARAREGAAEDMVAWAVRARHPDRFADPSAQGVAEAIFRAAAPTHHQS